LSPSLVWFFDLDDTLHDAHCSAMPALSLAMRSTSSASWG
jgi:FMN phosphatase YigB (HAD superfamily)